MGFSTPVTVILIGLLAFNLPGISTELTGDKVCQDEERFLVNVTRFFLRNVTVRGYEWCMQVPPRCSTYTLQLINDSRTVEEERISNVRRCCKGYKPALRQEICVNEHCPDCDHGTCDASTNICECDAGYKGINCNEGCDVGRWGKGCVNICNCGDHGICDKITGRCYCPPTLTLNGLRCEPSCSREKPDKECVFQCICFPIKLNSTTTSEDYSVPTEDMLEETAEDVLEDAEDAQYTSNESTNYQFVKSADFRDDIKEEHNSQYRKLTENDYPFDTKPWVRRSSTYPHSYFTTEAYREPTMRGFEHYNEKTYIISTSTTISTDDAIITTIKPSTTESTKPPETSNQNNLYTSEATIISSTVTEVTTNTSSSGLFHEADDLVIDSRLFITVISAVLFAVLVIFVALAFCVLHKLKEKKRKCELKIKEAECGNSSGTTVSVTTRSIFHAPLPDPPPFQNPVFSLPFDSSQQPNAIEVVCNMNFPKTSFKQEQLELFYDHPPSTGSYRAASIPEPPSPDIDKNFDPIYDEIPHKINIAVSSPPSYISDSSTLYMNT